MKCSKEWLVNTDHGVFNCKPVSPSPHDPKFQSP